MVREAIRRSMDAAQSLTDVPRERAEEIARRLAGIGLIDPGQIRGVASDIVGRGRENRRRLADLVARELRRQISRIGLASTDDLERLRRRVQALETAARSNRGVKQPAARKRAGTRKATAKSTTRKRPAARR